MFNLWLPTPGGYWSFPRIPTDLQTTKISSFVENCSFIGENLWYNHKSTRTWSRNVIPQLGVEVPPVFRFLANCPQMQCVAVTQKWFYGGRGQGPQRPKCLGGPTKVIMWLPFRFTAKYSKCFLYLCVFLKFNHFASDNTQVSKLLIPSLKEINYFPLLSERLCCD